MVENVLEVLPTVDVPLHVAIEQARSGIPGQGVANREYRISMGFQASGGNETNN